MKKYVVRLTAGEREGLKELANKGKGAAYKIKHANILLQVDADGPNWTDEKVAEAYHCHLKTVCNVRQRFVELGMEAALERKEQEKPSRELIIDGEAEAHLIKIACGQPPVGRNKWTMQLLADKLVELKIVRRICRETVRQTLKKKRTQAASSQMLGNSSGSGWRIRSCDGGYSRGVQATV